VASDACGTGFWIRCLGPISRSGVCAGTDLSGCKLLKRVEAGLEGLSLPFAADGVAWREVLEKKLVKIVPEENDRRELGPRHGRGFGGGAARGGRGVPAPSRGRLMQR
jgi:hypothetical protein